MIEGTIPVQKFEIIRDRIGEILTLELNSQIQRIGDTSLNDLSVWIERVIPFANSEFPAISVGFIKSDIVEYNNIDSTYDLEYYIDVHASGQARLEGEQFADGDKDALIRLQRICGLIRSILTHPLYRNFGISPSFVRTHTVESINITDPYNQDGDFTALARITVSVRLVESNTTEDARVGTGNTTNIRLDSTEKGYKFELNN